MRETAQPSGSMARSLLGHLAGVIIPESAFGTLCRSPGQSEPLFNLASSN
jgi:hypothetical protein